MLFLYSFESAISGALRALLIPPTLDGLMFKSYLFVEAPCVAWWRMAGACGHLEASKSYPLAVLGGLGGSIRASCVFFRCEAARATPLEGLKKASRRHFAETEKGVSSVRRCHFCDDSRSAGKEPNSMVYN